MTPQRRMIGHARWRILSLGSRRSDPVAEADRLTSGADARTALCLALGVDMADIDPASGHDRSFAAYQRSRDSWLIHIREWGPTDHNVRDCREVGQRWREKCPQWVELLPWPEPTEDDR